MRYFIVVIIYVLICGYCCTPKITTNTQNAEYIHIDAKDPDLNCRVAEYCNNIPNIPSYDEFIKNASIPQRADSIITNRIHEIHSILKTVLLKKKSLFNSNEKIPIQIEITPNGITKLSRNTDNLELYPFSFNADTYKKINEKLSVIRFDSIPDYIACKEIRFTVKMQNNQIVFSKFTSEFISEERSDAAILCVVMQNLHYLWNVYNRRLEEKPGIEGRMTVRWGINGQGDVFYCMVLTSTFKDLKLKTEILNKIKEWKFPKLYRTADNTNVVTPFEFSQ